MANPIVALALGIALFASHPSHAAARRDPWRVVSVAEAAPKLPDEAPTAVIRFAGGFVLHPHLYGVSVIGRLRSSSGEPFLVVGGSVCVECDAETRAVFIGRPTVWPKNPEPEDLEMGRGLVFAPYPFRNFQMATKTLWGWSRFFIGRCIPNGRESVVSFEAEREEANAPWSRAVSWAYIDGDVLSTHRAKEGDPTAPALAAAVRAANRKACREIPQAAYDEPF